MSGRSYLFVPGNRPDRFENARSAGADAVILGLEDAVPSEKKTETREAVSAWLSPERPAYVRVNGTATPWFWDDLEAVARPGLAGVVLPKAEDPDEISEVTSRLPEEASVLPLLETAAGVWDARALAEAPRVERLAFGSIDFRLDAGIDGEAEELLYARSRLVLASRVAGILPPLDGVTAALDDPDRLAEDVDHARRLGFGGKLCIHPEQIEVVNGGIRAIGGRGSLGPAGARGGGSGGDGSGPVRGRDDRPSRHRAREENTRPGHPPGLTGTGPSPQGRSRPWLVGNRSRPAFAPTAKYLRQRRLTCLRGDVGDSSPGGTLDVVPVDKTPQGSAPPKTRALKKP